MNLFKLFVTTRYLLYESLGLSCFTACNPFVGEFYEINRESLHFVGPIPDGNATEVEIPDQEDDFNFFIKEDEHILKYRSGVALYSIVHKGTKKLVCQKSCSKSSYNKAVFATSLSLEDKRLGIFTFVRSSYSQKIFHYNRIIDFFNEIPETLGKIWVLRSSVKGTVMGKVLLMDNLYRILACLCALSSFLGLKNKKGFFVMTIAIFSIVIFLSVVSFILNVLENDDNTKVSIYKNPVLRFFKKIEYGRNILDRSKYCVETMGSPLICGGGNSCYAMMGTLEEICDYSDLSIGVKSKGKIELDFIRSKMTSVSERLQYDVNNCKFELLCNKIVGETEISDDSKIISLSKESVKVRLIVRSNSVFCNRVLRISKTMKYSSYCSLYSLIEGMRNDGGNIKYFKKVFFDSDAGSVIRHCDGIEELLDELCSGERYFATFELENEVWILKGKINTSIYEISERHNKIFFNGLNRNALENIWKNCYNHTPENVKCTQWKKYQIDFSYIMERMGIAFKIKKDCKYKRTSWVSEFMDKEFQTHNGCKEEKATGGIGEKGVENNRGDENETKRNMGGWEEKEELKNFKQENPREIGQTIANVSRAERRMMFKENKKREKKKQTQSKLEEKEENVTVEQDSESKLFSKTFNENLDQVVKGSTLTNKSKKIKSLVKDLSEGSKISFEKLRGIFKNFEETYNNERSEKILDLENSFKDKEDECIKEIHNNYKDKNFRKFKIKEGKKDVRKKKVGVTVENLIEDDISSVRRRFQTLIKEGISKINLDFENKEKFKIREIFLKINDSISFIGSKIYIMDKRMTNTNEGEVIDIGNIKSVVEKLKIYSLGDLEADCLDLIKLKTESLSLLEGKESLEFLDLMKGSFYNDVLKIEEKFEEVINECECEKFKSKFKVGESDGNISDMLKRNLKSLKDIKEIFERLGKRDLKPPNKEENKEDSPLELTLNKTIELSNKIDFQGLLKNKISTLIKPSGGERNNGDKWKLGIKTKKFESLKRNESIITDNVAKVIILFHMIFGRLDQSKNNIFKIEWGNNKIPKEFFKKSQRKLIQLEIRAHLDLVSKTGKRYRDLIKNVKNVKGPKEEKRKNSEELMHWMNDFQF